MNGILFNQMYEIPISNVKPKGWLKDNLLRQKNGLTGNLDKIGFPFKSVSWATSDIDTTTQNENPGWWAYEQTAYLLDGIIRCGSLLKDDELLNKAKISFDYVLNNADKDGYLGPKFLRKINESGYNRWPHVVFFRALFAEFSRTNNQEILNAIIKHYMGCPVDYSNQRDILNLEILLLAYIYCGNKELLNMAIKNYDEYNKKCDDDYCVKAFLSDKPIYGHGVSFNEFAKLGVMLYICTGDEEYLKPVFKAYEKVDKYHMLPSGLHCCNEYLLDNDHMQTHEMCDVTDYTWTLGYLLMATGDGIWADKIEKCIFNAGFGAVDDNFKSIQYLSGLNQVICTDSSNHSDYFKGYNWMSYRPLPDVECCPANSTRFLPNYCARMYMQKDNQIFANLYGPNETEFNIDGSNFKICQQTAYPFEDKIIFKFETTKEESFAFNLRIPQWCKNPSITLNRQNLDFNTIKGYAKIDGKFNNGDIIELTLPSDIEFLNHIGGGSYIQKGPLVYSLAIDAKEELITTEPKTTKEFPAYNLYPASSWNYAILENTDFEFENLNNGTDSPWVLKECPYSIKIKAKKINNWDLEKTNTVYGAKGINKRRENYMFPWERSYLRGDFTFTPRLPDDKFIENNLINEIETIKLVPMGATRLRLTLFAKTK